ncbi:hypothetical protein [Spiroplasma endosymbiont of Melieria omissa]|uniref:hypothetical protein n=1 Tax=Spiroplasma endosymbiont of Melieria omissa TaxID=3139324 RepID=UPI003CCB3886
MILLSIIKLKLVIIFTIIFFSYKNITAQTNNIVIITRIAKTNIINIRKILPNYWPNIKKAIDFVFQDMSKHYFS